MGFFLQGWGKVETSNNGPIYTLHAIEASPPQVPVRIPPRKIGSFGEYNYYADAIATDQDEQIDIAVPGYFDSIRFDLQVTDIITAYSAEEGSTATYIVTHINNASPYVVISQFNLGVGEVVTADFADEAVTYEKIQDVSANQLLGNAQVFEGEAQEISLGNGLGFNATTLEVSRTLLNHESGVITAAEWKDIYDTPIRLVQNPSINKLIIVERVLLRQIYAGAQYTGGGDVIVGYGDSSEGLAEPAATSITAAAINGIDVTGALSAVETTDFIFEQVTVGQDIYISNQDVPFATGTGDWEFNISYKVV